MNYPNGRVNILDNAPNNVFNLYDKIPVEQNITSYRNALTGNLEDNMFSFIKDLSDEGSTDIKHSLVRCKKEEPLTA